MNDASIRLDALRLKHSESEVRALRQCLASMRYVGEDMRDLLKVVLRVGHDLDLFAADAYKRVFGLYLRVGAMSRVQRADAVALIDEVLARWSTIERLSAHTDEERLAEMFDVRGRLREPCFRTFFDEWSATHLYKNGLGRLVVSGRLSEDIFFANVRARFGFDHPQTCIEYSENADIPRGQLNHFKRMFSRG